MDWPAATSDLSPAILQSIALTLGQQVQNVTSLVHGQSHETYKIELHGGRKFCLRKPRTKEAAMFAKRGLEVLKLLKDTQPSLPAPAIIHEADSDYTILQYLDGDPLVHSQAIPWDQRHLLLKGLAAFLFSLWTVSIPAKTGSASSYYDWLYDEIDKGFRRSLESDRWGDPQHFLHRRMLACRYVPDDDDATVAVKHGDLNAWNVLVDGLGLSGVIDWDTAQSVPLPAAVHHPLFIADIPGWNNDNAPSDMDLHIAREILEHEVKQLVDASTIPSAMRTPELLSTSFERQFLELSLRNRRINNEYIKARLCSRHIDCAAALKELDRFLDRNRDLLDHEAILELRKKLSD